MFSVISDQLLEDSPPAEEPPHKRQRVAAENGNGKEGTGSPESRLPAAFHLLRTKGIADQANEYVHGLSAMLSQTLPVMNARMAYTSVVVIQGHAGSEAQRRGLRPHALGVHQQLHGRPAVAVVRSTGPGRC